MPIITFQAPHRFTQILTFGKKVYVASGNPDASREIFCFQIQFRRERLLSIEI
jgi:hypothetical protein